MNSNGPSSEDIISALKQSGYLMEQEVGTALEVMGFDVKTNRAYEDVDESKSREIDVWGYKVWKENNERKLRLMVEVICECKNNNSPFVFIQREKGALDNYPRPQEYLFPVTEYVSPIGSEDGGAKTVQLVPPFLHLNLSKQHYYYKNTFKTVQFCKVTRKGKGWEAGHGDIYDGIFYPCVKAFLARRREAREYMDRHGGGWKHIFLLFPMVILSGKIYSLDANSSVLEEKTDVTFIRELKSEKIKGHFALDFVSKGSLKDFINNKISSFANHIAGLVENNPNVLLSPQADPIE